MGKLIDEFIDRFVRNAGILAYSVNIIRINNPMFVNFLTKYRPILMQQSRLNNRNNNFEYYWRFIWKVLRCFENCLASCVLYASKYVRYLIISITTLMK